MPATLCHRVRFLFAIGVAATAGASTAEARHWRFHWHYHYGSYQGTDEGRDEDSARATFGNYRSRNEADDFNRGIKRMIGACAGQAIELKTMPFDLVSRTVQPNDGQNNALEQVRSTANEAAATLSASCPKDIPAELGPQLDRLGDALNSISASLAALRPAWRPSTMHSMTSRRRTFSTTRFIERTFCATPIRWPAPMPERREWME